MVGDGLFVESKITTAAPLPGAEELQELIMCECDSESAAALLAKKQNKTWW